MSCTAAGSLDRRSPALLQQNIPEHQGPVVGCICLEYESRAALLRRRLHQFTMFQMAALLLAWEQEKGGKLQRQKFSEHETCMKFARMEQRLGDQERHCHGSFWSCLLQAEEGINPFLCFSKSWFPLQLPLGLWHFNISNDEFLLT